MLTRIRKNIVVQVIQSVWPAIYQELEKSDDLHMRVNLAQKIVPEEPFRTTAAITN